MIKRTSRKHETMRRITMTRCQKTRKQRTKKIWIRIQNIESQQKIKNNGVYDQGGL